MKIFSWLLISSIIILSTVFTTGCTNQSQSESSENGDKSAQSGDDLMDLQAVTCMEFLKTDGEERANILVFMHGFMNGKKGDTTINPPALTEATDNIIDTCIDNPNNKLASVFEKNR